MANPSPPAAAATEALFDSAVFAEVGGFDDDFELEFAVGRYVELATGGEGLPFGAAR